MLRGPDGDSWRLTSQRRRDARLRLLWILSLFEYDFREDERKDVELLWRLYDSTFRAQPNGKTYTRQRVLWRLFHREKLGERVSVDIFPFIAYDRSEELFSWSFMGGLLGYQTKQGRRTFKFLYLPIGS